MIFIFASILLIVTFFINFFAIHFYLIHSSNRNLLNLLSNIFILHIIFDYSVLKIVLIKNSNLLYINICLINVKTLNISIIIFSKKLYISFII